ncbi:hypothetical protein [Duganella sp. BuS-21]|uniref:hypothetical protein n=1 Tax=Duganella sp. BuS-21 TaxID=2943848 RepID=UPI0035A6A35C
MTIGRRKYYGEALILMGLMAAAGAIYAAFSLMFEGLPFNDYARGVCSFACFGLLLGAIHAFDKESARGTPNRPSIRLVVGCLCGLTIGIIWHWPVQGLALATMIGAILGLLGNGWAKWVEF